MIRKHIITCATLMFLLTACTMFQPTAAPPATVDMDTLSTMIAGTAMSLAEQTVAAAPTRTPTVTPTETPTATPTSVFSAQGTALTKLEDGSTRFVDNKAGYELLIPNTWLTLRINEQEFFNAWSLPEATSDVDLQKQLTYIQGQDPSLFRLFAFDLKPESKKQHLIPNINLVWDKVTGATMTLGEVLDQVEKTYPDTFGEMREMKTDILTSDLGYTYASVIYSYDTKNAYDEDMTITQQQAIFKLSEGLLVVTFTMNEDVRDAFANDIDTVIQSVTIPPNP
jgi:hypothetical protein